MCQHPFIWQKSRIRAVVTHYFTCLHCLPSLWHFLEDLAILHVGWNIKVRDPKWYHNKLILCLPCWHPIYYFVPVPATPLLIQLAAYDLGKQQKIAEVFGFLNPSGSPGRSTSILDLDRLSSIFSCRLASETTDEELCSSVSVYLSL